jgi:hypothetical protein
MKDEALKLALEALEMAHELEENYGVDFKKYGLKVDKDIRAKYEKALAVIKQALAAPVQKGAIGAEYQKSPWDEKGISMPLPEAPVQEPVAYRQTGWAAHRDHYAVPVLFNPYTGDPRDVRDVQSDPQGILIVPPGKVEMLAAKPTHQQGLQVSAPPAAPDLQAELEATNRQVEILSDALAESRREVARLKAVQEPVAWHDKIIGMEVSMDVSTGDDDIDHRVYGQVYEVMLAYDGGPDVILAIESERNFTTPPATPDLQAELEATNRQVEILSDALAESRREVDALVSLARADERDKWMERAHIMILGEREACAKVCDDIGEDLWSLYKGRSPYTGKEEGRADMHVQGKSDGADECAAAIRARGNT